MIAECFDVTPLERATLADRARRLIAQNSAMAVGLALTLAVAVLYGPSVWYVRSPVVMIAMVGWLWPGALRSPRLWTVLTAVLAAGVYLQRFTIDNHQYLMAYWSAAIALSLGDERSLARNARLLVGLAFAFAAAWKWASPEFVAGDFLEYEMLCDPRFAGFAEVVAGLPREAIDANHSALANLGGATTAALAAPLATTPLVSTIADAMTWSTLALETWIAVAFLLPQSCLVARHRDLPLLAFLFTTYSIATVPGFGYLLLVMGFVQCERRRWWVPAGYLCAVLVLQVFLLPLRHIASAFGF